MAEPSPTDWIDPAWGTPAVDPDRVPAAVADALRALLAATGTAMAVVPFPDAIDPATTVAHLTWTDGPTCTDLARLLTGSPDAGEDDLIHPLTGTGPHRVRIRLHRHLSDAALLAALTHLRTHDPDQPLTVETMLDLEADITPGLRIGSLDATVHALWSQIVAARGEGLSDDDELVAVWQDHQPRIAELRKALA